jgi:hypothetical protein
MGGKAKFLRVCQQQRLLLAGMKDLERARRTARLFDPDRAAGLLPSSAHFWKRLNMRWQATSA